MIENNLNDAQLIEQTLEAVAARHEDISPLVYAQFFQPTHKQRICSRSWTRRSRRAAVDRCFLKSFLCCKTAHLKKPMSQDI